MKKIRKIKVSAARRLNQIKEGKLSLQVKILIILTFFALSLTIAGIVNVSYNCGNVFPEHFEKRLTETYDGVLNDMLSGTAPCNEFLSQLPTRHKAALDSAMAGSSLNQLRDVLHDAIKAGGYKGFIISTANGDIVRETSYTSAQGEVPTSATNAISAKSNSMSGFCILPARGLCAVSSRVFSNSAGTPALGVTIVLHELYDCEYLDALKLRHKADLTIFKGDERIATTLRNDKGQRIIGTHVDNKAALDTVYNNHHMYVGEAEVNGQTSYVLYDPVMDEKNVVYAMFYVGIDAAVSTELTGKLMSASLIGSILISLIITIACFLYIRHYVTIPIREVAQAARRIAEKDLSTEVKTYSTGDEIDYLSACVADMRESLRTTIEEVQDASSTLRASSEELSKASMTLSDGANKQAASLEEIASSVEQMTANILQNTENSRNTDSLMSQADKAIVEIAKMSDESMAASKKIAGAIRNINTLVKQTNILSLNAAVEAARAGNKGRGFAVVAKEVGRLAEQTRTTAMSVSETAETSIASAVAVDTKLDEVAPHLSKVVALMKEITASCEEQGQGAEHINIAIADLNGTTQHTAANAEEIAANAEELASTADHMHDIVTLFKV